MKFRVLSAFALPVACNFATAAIAQAATAASECEVHVYPADGLHSVGEDFDAVHRVDQDLKAYYGAAGQELNWLSVERQLAILKDISVGSGLGIDEKSRTAHDEPLTRREAIEPGPRATSGGCLVELMLPQIMLERGGLATRSLRLFGVMRRYEDGALVKSYSGYAAAPMTGFRLKTPEDVPAATMLVEKAYREAVQMILRNAAAKAKPPATT